MRALRAAKRPLESGLLSEGRIVPTIGIRSALLSEVVSANESTITAQAILGCSGGDTEEQILRHHAAQQKYEAMGAAP